MKKLLCPVFFLISSLAFGQKFSGNWQGAISIGNNMLPLVFHLQDSANNSLTGTWDSPMQNAIDLKFSSLEVKGDSLIAKVENLGASYEGKLEGTDSIAGTWKQGIAVFPLGLKKTLAKDAPAKIQNEAEVSIPVAGGVQLKGSLVAANKEYPLVIIIAGSGPTDRNGNNPLGVHTDTYRLLAKDLMQQGISSFRYDKRGIGGSMTAQMKESDLRFDEYVNDVKSIVDYFRNQGYSRIFLAGHSEGSLLGMIAAETEKLSGYISIAGVGVPAGEILKEQMSGKIPGVADSTIDRIIKSLDNGQTLTNVPPQLQSIFRPSIQPYLINWFRYNPGREIQKVTCPILILQGTCDIQVGVSNATDLFNASGKNATIKIIQNMSHVLKDAGPDCRNQQQTYTDSEMPLSPALVSDIVNFIRKNPG